MEVKPNQTSTISGELRTSLNLDASVMLKVVMDIMMELHDMVELASQETKTKFLAKNLEKFDQHLVTPFPYIQDDSSKKTPESGGKNCVYQNLSVGIMYLSFVQRHRQRFFKQREKIFNFVSDAIEAWKTKDQEFNTLMKNFIHRLFRSEIVKIFPDDSKRIFHQLVKHCNIDQMTHDPKLELVCSIIEKSNSISKDSIYSLIIPQMVQKIGNSPVVPIHLIDTVGVLAKQGNKIVLENLDANVVDIVENLLSRMRFVGNLHQEERLIKCKVANLVYWVNSTDILESVRRVLKSDKLSLYIKEIIDLKIC